MTVIEWLGVVSAILSILAFIYAVWVRLRTDIKVRELEGVIQAAYDVTGTILWEMQAVPIEDPTARLRSTERSLGEVSALRAVTGRYVRDTAGFRQTELGELIERGVVWSTAMLWDVETSERVKEVWLLTPDLEPDLSDPAAGAVVGQNLKHGKRYVYFCSSRIRNLEAEKQKLFANLGILKSARLISRVTIIPIDEEHHEKLFRRGNAIIFFFDDPAWETGRAFEEMVFTKVPERGIFWQECAPMAAQQIQAILKQELEDWKARDPALREVIQKRQLPRP